MLFTLIVLTGTDWSFLKPYLQGKEKKFLIVFIPLQVLDNISTVVIDETGPYAKDWLAWNQVFLLVYMICCCAVLFPIVLFLQRCLDQLNLCEGDAQNMQLKLKLLSIVVKYMMHRPNFSIVFCEAVKNTHTGESILGDLSKTLHLSLPE